MTPHERLVKLEIPYWVLKDLVHEKKGWVREQKSRGEGHIPFEEWIVTHLSVFLKKKKERMA